MRVQLRYLIRIGVLLGMLGIVAACGGRAPQLSQAEIQATIDASVRATTAAQQKAAASTSAPTSPATTSAPTPPPSPTTAPETPTTAVFTPPIATETSGSQLAQTASATASASASEATTAATQTVAGPNITVTREQSTAGPGETSTATVGTAPPADAGQTVFTPASGGGAQTVNVELVFDASGSMAENIGGKTKIAAAQRAMQRVIDALPGNTPSLNVGFRVFGHKGTNTEADKALSCQSTDLLVPLQGVNKDVLRQQASAWQPMGWTPLTLALQKAGEDLRAGDNVRNVIIMVTDGQETCEGDPCATAKALAQSKAQVRIDIVGFGQNPKDAAAVKCIAENGGGTFTDVRNGDALAKTLQELINASVQRSELRILAVGADGQPSGSVRLDQLVDAANKPVDARDLLGVAGNPLLDGEARYELPPGTYRFTVSGRFPALAGGQDVNVSTTYTAIVAAGQTTTAYVGLGGLLLQDDGAPERYICGLALQAAEGGQWQNVRGPATIGCFGALEFNKTYGLTPGRYRIVDRKRGDTVVADNIGIQAGKVVTLRLKGS